MVISLIDQERPYDKQTLILAPVYDLGSTPASYKTCGLAIAPSGMREDWGMTCGSLCLV